ncbi:MAG TPA: nucleoside-diphosphate-sugar epimerase [Deltaproteobacteria bacterium]|nr:MAG: nucleoside-diphosphate-sugar epimerase [Deltaproteobacteria bacterium GWA2_55_82]OGQ63867.1 MAG: nucleoside-diphosphate-sugar epimerase [Deltaproteobacteria bacterium RIFCSPLOWO2_02_FULL_55_12]OIJ72669.1 MAG: nucleoside-diphosphate-sugar epimerase [Deltaproteobacteria bacterium GWC2_55_46]HBG47576.1 nucleoside-diphosphate-sugar epimerase [Deltaproteobacteria bacterium]HCY10487.1 nucleoside-diphosphate-sugar epimerase [Deltaproteobacteria bacterium]
MASFLARPCGRWLVKNILITGGAGFVGSHLADELLGRGYKVRALDSLTEQVHGPEKKRPEYLSPEVELIVGDIRDREAVRKALEGMDAVVHLAAAVGVGQSMYMIEDYVDVNCRGTAVLLETLIKKPVERLVTASSMSVYGEGSYRTEEGVAVQDAARMVEQLKAREWELKDAAGERLTPVPTPESKPPSISSVYALTKYDQEKMCLVTGRAYNMPVVALRFFNVYGPRQAFSNPYTGVLAIFSARLMNGKPPLIYEDGMQMRDFVNARDVARACRLALESPAAAYAAINVGCGESYSIIEIAGRLGKVFGKRIAPQVTGRYRVGDIRHCFADITLAKSLLGYEPEVTMADGLIELAAWLEGKAACDRVAEACEELANRGLTI